MRGFGKHVGRFLKALWEKIEKSDDRNYKKVVENQELKVQAY